MCGHIITTMYLNITEQSRAHCVQCAECARPSAYKSTCTLRCACLATLARRANASCQRQIEPQWTTKPALLSQRALPLQFGAPIGVCNPPMPPRHDFCCCQSDMHLEPLPPPLDHIDLRSGRTTIATAVCAFFCFQNGNGGACRDEKCVDGGFGVCEGALNVAQAVVGLEQQQQWAGQLAQQQLNLCRISWTADAGSGGGGNVNGRRDVVIAIRQKQQ